ncbi:permease prefix domain 1-containing protein [Chloroflexota bacterium]
MTSQVLSKYLNNLQANLRLNTASENEVLSELKTHLEDAFDDMIESGLSEDEAAKACIKLLGSSQLIASQIYEVHSQGTWKQALLASIPHILFAALFALNWWQGIGWVTATLGIVLGIAIIGWLHNKPMWLFPWLGYSMAPVLAAGILLLYLPKVWSWITILIYIPLALWLIYSVTIHAVKRDWLCSALMLLPMPIVIGWFLAVEQEGSPFQLSTEYIRQFAPLIALSFLALAGVAAAFVRMKKRWLRTTLIISSQLILLILVTCYADGRLALPASLLLALTMVGLFLGLSLLDHRIRYKKKRSNT